ncbi:hypothetical protein [Brumimicrobium mesophilum]|uniref:hypothetical protein n=1 Tax=Brumimicrobium mesophilum TaxID=392717 RepID=UPI000D14246F|nr:hypothetical protein [Brumimicrobium mesophilum]
MKLLIIISGIITCLPVIYSLAPRWALRKLNDTNFSSESGLFVKHWGILCLMMGISIIYAGLNPVYLPVILSMAIFEKLLLVVLIFQGYQFHKNSFYKGFLSTMIFDLICSSFYIFYLNAY